MMIRAVFFDVGYTLFDESRLWREWAEWLGVSEERLFTELRHVIEEGRDHREAFQVLRPGFDLEAEQTARIQAGRPHRLRASDVYADARPCLANVKARGRLVGVAGNFPSDVIDEALMEAGLPVDVVGTPDRWGASKPSTEFFQRLIKEAGVPAEQIAYVGDRLDYDVLPARGAGIHGILLERGPWGEVHAPQAAALRVPVITSLEKLPFVIRGLRPIRGSTAEMTQADAVEILRLLKSRGIEVWVDGGWGVDALLGNQSRPHDDLDLVLRQSDIGRLTEVLGVAGFRRVEDGARPFNFVMADRQGREVDLHGVVFDTSGDGLYGPKPKDGSGRMYPAAAFKGEGTIAGETVGCLTAEYQVANHTGYDPGDADVRDVYALHHKFGIPVQMITRGVREARTQPLESFAMIAVSAWFDNISEAAVRDLWRKMAEAAVDDSLHDGPYRPHITLGVWEEAQVDAASKQLSALTSEFPAFPLKFRAIGIFPGHTVHQDRTPGVWLAPTITSELRELHERVHSAMSEIATGSMHRHLPDRWEPHCTIAWRLNRRLLSLATDVVIDASVLPLAVTITRIGLITTPAEIELRSFQLRG